MEDFENEANNLQASVNTLSAEISANGRALAGLEREKSGLQSQLKSHQGELSRSKAELKALERQIAGVDKTKRDISTLQDHAISTTTSVRNALLELQSIKTNLEQCSDLVKEKSLDVSTSCTLTERLTGMLPVIGTSWKRGKMLRKQMVVIQQVCNTLNHIHAEVPTLLPSKNDKFLDIKPWGSDGARVSVSEVMPGVCLY